MQQGEISGRLDSNQRFPAPQTGAITRLRYGPMPWILSSSLFFASPTVLVRRFRTPETRALPPAFSGDLGIIALGKLVEP